MGLLLLLSWGSGVQLVGEGIWAPLSLRLTPSGGEQGLPSATVSTGGSMGHVELSVEILSTMLERQSRLETTELFPCFGSKKQTKRCSGYPVGP